MSKANVLKFFVLAVIFVLAAPANAQLTKYRFTGTATGSSNPALGTTVSGIVTIDSGTPLVDYDGTGLLVRFGETSISFETSTGISGLTSEADGENFSGDWDRPEDGYQFTDYQTIQLVTFVSNDFPSAPASDEPNQLSLFQFFVGYFERQQNNSAPLTNWNPFEADTREIRVTFFNVAPNIERASATYELDTLELIPNTIIVNGVDTGIKDFEFQGQQVSALLDKIAADAISYGMYDSTLARTFRRLQQLNIISESQMMRVLRQLTVIYYTSSVTRLAADLRRAGLLTRSEARDLVRQATQSFMAAPAPVS